MISPNSSARAYRYIVNETIQARINMPTIAKPISLKWSLSSLIASQNPPCQPSRPPTEPSTCITPTTLATATETAVMTRLYWSLRAGLTKAQL